MPSKRSLNLEDNNNHCRSLLYSLDGEKGPLTLTFRTHETGWVLAGGLRLGVMGVGSPIGPYLGD